MVDAFTVDAFKVDIKSVENVPLDPLMVVVVSNPLRMVDPIKLDVLIVELLIILFMVKPYPAIEDSCNTVVLMVDAFTVDAFKVDIKSVENVPLDPLMVVVVSDPFRIVEPTKLEYCPMLVNPVPVHEVVVLMVDPTRVEYCPMLVNPIPVHEVVVLIVEPTSVE
jgi:hypothetical protein